MDDKRKELMKFMTAINRLDGFYFNIARRLNINENEFALLYALFDEECHTQRQIYEDWLIPRTTINSVTKKFVSLGYIELIPIGHREKELALTEKGKSYLNTVFSSFFAAENAAFAKTIGDNAELISNSIFDFISEFETAMNGERPDT